MSAGVAVGWAAANATTAPEGRRRVPVATSMDSWWCCRKSAPRMAVVVSATMNAQGNLCPPPSSWILAWPWIVIDEPLAALRLGPVAGSRLELAGMPAGGRMLTWAPVSTIRVSDPSLTCSRRASCGWPERSGVVPFRPDRLPAGPWSRCRALHTCVQLPRTAGGSSRVVEVEGGISAVTVSVPVSGC